MVVKKLVKALEKDGWIFVRQKGSHMIFKKDGKICPVPNHHGDIDKGTLAKIIKITGVTI